MYRIVTVSLAAMVGATEMAVALFADGTPEALSGGSGWVGAGLLGLVLAWVFLKHLPDKDKRDQEKDKLIVGIVEAKDEQSKEKDRTHDLRMDAQRKEFTDALKEITLSLKEVASTFKSEASAERVACEKHFATLAESMNKAFETLGKQLSEHSIRNQQWLETLKQELANRKAELAEMTKTREAAANRQ